MKFIRGIMGSADEEGDDPNKPNSADPGKTAEVDMVTGGDTLPTLRVDPSKTRQLPMETIISVDNSRLAFGQSTDTGLVRQENEDSMLAFFSSSDSVEEHPDFGVFIVADGMGGYQKGEVASAIAVRVVAENVIQKIYVPMLTGFTFSDIPPVRDVLEEAINKANSEVNTSISGKSGTTCTAAIVLGERFYVGHVGDSRAYLIGKDKIEQLTKDHSTVQRLIEMGQLTPEEAASSKSNNELYRALGFREDVEIDTLSRPIQARSKLLLCSDGLWNHVKEEDILRIVQQYGDPQEATDKLVALANTNGGSDNITAILLHLN